MFPPPLVYPPLLILLYAQHELELQPQVDLPTIDTTRFITYSATLASIALSDVEPIWSVQHI